MRNQHPGTCYRCKQIVAAGAGHFERYQGGWRVQHAGCAITGRAAKRKDARTAPPSESGGQA